MTEKGENKDDWVRIRIEKGKKDEWKKKWKAFDKMGLEMGKIFDNWSGFIRYAIDTGIKTMEEEILLRSMYKFIDESRTILSINYYFFFLGMVHTVEEKYTKHDVDYDMKCVINNTEILIIFKSLSEICKYKPT